jgi:hypothetical protein
MGKWDLSPGYERYNQPYVVRPVLPGCLECHSSRVQHLEGTQNGYADTPFLEGGVSCERCHGPGSEHIAKPTRENIVNPSKLEAERRDSVCAQCHLTGEARVARAGQKPNSFTAGDRLQDHVAVFVRANGAGRMRVTSHVENLAQSACKQASGDKMWCGTCHDPHTDPSKVDYRAKCLTCHQPHKDNKGSDCVSCHMPKNTVTDAQHVVYTDHAIPRKPRQHQASQSADMALKPFGAGKAEDRDLGTAYAMRGQRDKAFALLNSSTPRDAEALMYLADLHKQRGNRDHAIHLFEEAMRLDPAQLTGSVTLGAIRMEQGDYNEAIRLWKDALSKNPGLLLTRTNLAAALLQAGAKGEAEAVLSEAKKYNPEYTPPRHLIERLKRN